MTSAVAVGRVALAACAALILAACVSAPPRPGVPAAQALRWQQAREARVAGQPDWTLAGRIAVSSGRGGGSGRIDWTRSGDGYAIAVSAPITRQSWRLVGDAGHARLEGLPGGPRESEAPGALLFEATGWDVPLASLAWWVRGVAAPGGPGRLEFGPDGLPRTLAQHGWTIAYDWPDGAVNPEFPARIEARRDSARVKLVIDQARLGTAPAATGAP